MRPDGLGFHRLVLSFPSEGLGEGSKEFGRGCFGRNDEQESCRFRKDFFRLVEEVRSLEKKS